MVQAKKSHFESLLATPHPDVDYLKQQDISLVLSKALTETFKAQPLEPKKYFAKYLLNYAERTRKEQEVSYSPSCSSYIFEQAFTYPLA